MRTRRLGSTGLRVSELAFGTMTFGHGGLLGLGDSGIDEAATLVGACLDAGVTLFDTADFYAGGQSEEILGKCLAGHRDDVVVATKVALRTGEGANDVGLSRRHVITSCEASLRRLGTDRIDLYQAHAFDAQTPLEETLRAFDDLVRAGKVRYVGCSNHTAWQLTKALGVAERDRVERYGSVQAYYNLAARELEHEIVPACLDQGVGILVWSPLAGGFLSGKYADVASAVGGPGRGGSGAFRALDPATADAVLGALRTVAAARGVSVPQVALNWLRRKPGVTSIVLGARTPAQLADNLGAASWDLDDAELAALDDASARPLPYPLWHTAAYNAERGT
jgi:aryl-alcohol dehydrogenase-like predicted oxidoreductase